MHDIFQPLLGIGLLNKRMKAGDKRKRCDDGTGSMGFNLDAKAIKGQTNSRTKLLGGIDGGRGRLWPTHGRAMPNIAAMKGFPRIPGGFFCVNRITDLMRGIVPTHIIKKKKLRNSAKKGVIGDAGGF